MLDPVYLCIGFAKSLFGFFHKMDWFLFKISLLDCIVTAVISAHI